MDKPTPVAYEADSSGNIYVEESDGQIWPTGCRIPRLASSRITAEEMKSALRSRCELHWAMRDIARLALSATETTDDA